MKNKICLEKQHHADYNSSAFNKTQENEAEVMKKNQKCLSLIHMKGSKLENKILEQNLPTCILLILNILFNKIVWKNW